MGARFELWLVVGLAGCVRGGGVPSPFDADADSSGTAASSTGAETGIEDPPGTTSGDDPSDGGPPVKLDVFLDDVGEQQDGCDKVDFLFVIDYVDAFGDRGLFGSVCETDYVPFFAEAVGLIDTACDDFTPQG